jgi:hypothetical protein
MIQYPIKIIQGVSFVRSISFKNADGSAKSLAGMTAKMQIRSSVGDSNVIAELSTDNGRITINASAGTVLLNISGADTAALSYPAEGVYSLQMTVTATGTVSEPISGPVEFVQDPTRAS